MLGLCLISDQSSQAQTCCEPLGLAMRLTTLGFFRKLTEIIIAHRNLLIKAKETEGHIFFTPEYQGIKLESFYSYSTAGASYCLLEA
jgi:hypothetical protein